MIRDQAYELRKLMKKKRDDQRLAKEAAHLRGLISERPDARQPRLTRVIAVTSGKGGVGKSTISANLSLHFASKGLETILLDADLGLANLDVILGIRPTGTLFEVIHGNRELNEIIQHGPMGLKFISGASGITDLANLGEKERDHLLSEISGLQYEGEIMVIDTGAGLSRNVLGFLMIAQITIVVVTEEPASVADGYGMIKALRKSRYPGEICVVMNKVNSIQSGKNLFDKLSMTADRFLGTGLKLVGIIPESPLIRESTQKMTPFFIAHPDSKVTQALRSVGEVVLGHSEYLACAEKEGFSRRMYSFFFRV